MNIRPKTIRRVSILLIILLVVISAGAVAYKIRMRHIEEAIMQHKTDGMRAFNDKDYPTAVTELSQYVSKHKEDADALFAFGISRGKVPTLDGSYISESINILRKYCSMQPDNIDAVHALLQMETPVPSFAGPATSQANDLLQSNSKDLVALRSLAQINSRERRYKEALDATLKYTQLDPTDLEMQRVALEMMNNTGKPAAKIRARADGLSKKYPDDPRFMLVQAMSYEYGRDAAATTDQRDQDIEAEIKLVKAAAVKDAPDAQFVSQIVFLLDQMQQFSISQDVLDRAAPRLNDPGITEILVRRLWQNDRFADLVKQVDSLDPASPKTAAEAIVFKARALFSLDKAADANALVKALAARNNDAAAVAWSAALKTLFDPSANPKARVTQYQNSLKQLPNDPYLQALLGDSYAQVGENEPALQEWRQAAARVPSWALPNVRVATYLSAIGHGADPEAIRDANRAINASKNEKGVVEGNALIADALVRFAHWQQTQDATEGKNLLDFIGLLQKNNPGEPRTLPMYVQLLAQMNQRDAAIDAIKTGETNAKLVGENALLKLATVSRDSKLGMERSIYDTIEKQFGMSPELALTESLDLLNANQVAAGLKYIRDAKAAAKSDTMQWDTAICKYLEMARDPGAADAWKKLGDAYPNDLTVQTMIVNSEDSAWNDRDFMSRSIERLKVVSGEDSVRWKLGRARWLLGGADAAKDAGAVVVLLTDVTKNFPDQYVPHRLLAAAYEKLAQTARDDQERQGSLENAVTEWNRTAELVPTSPQVLVGLLKAQQASGKRDEARVTFDRLAMVSNIPPDYALEASVAMFNQDELPRAERMLAKYPNPSAKMLHDATLAKVYWRQGRVTFAADLYFKLLDNRDLDAATIAEAATFFGLQHDLTAAGKFLDRLSGLSLTPGKQEMVRALFDEDFVNADAAAQQYALATKAAPDNAGIVAQQIGFFIRQRRWSDAQTAMKGAINHWPDDAQIFGEKKILDTVAAQPAVGENAMLMRALSQDPRSPAGNETLNVIAAAGRAPAGDTLQKLTDLLVKYPTFEPTYSLAVDQLILMHRLNDAVTLAVRAMNQFPNSADAARVAAVAYGNVGRWNDVLDAAQRWRERGLDNPLAADKLIAKAQMYTGQAKEAANRLAPYIPDAKTNPEQNAAVIMEYAQALILAGSESDAAALLHPLADNSAAFRARWMEIANSTHGDEASTLAWIEQIRPLLQADSYSEHVALADAYTATGQRFGSVKAYGLARDTLKPFVGKPEMTTAGLTALAGAATLANDSALAEQTYRGILAKDPKNAAVKNSLADLLRKRDDPAALKEAEMLSRDACSDVNSPEISLRLDTLARILVKQGRTTDAIAIFEQGVKAKPDDLNVLVGLADLYAQSNQIDKASRCIGQIDALVPPGRRLGSDLDQELQGTRDLVKKSLANGAGGGATPTVGTGNK